MSRRQYPEKMFYKIGEVARLLEVESYVLRYWETEFDCLAPKKTKSGQRAYRLADIQLLKRIKQYLYEDLYTIAGARQRLELSDEEGEEDVLRAECTQLQAEKAALLEKVAQLEADLATKESELEELRWTPPIEPSLSPEREAELTSEIERRDVEIRRLQEEQRRVDDAGASNRMRRGALLSRLRHELSAIEGITRVEPN